MSRLVFDESELETELSAASDDGRVAFGLLCCERMIPNYVAFSEQSVWGDPAVLRKALDACWESLIDGSAEIDWTTLKAQCDESAPDTEEFQTILVSSALDAAVATATLIDLLKTRDVEHAVSIASLARDTVDMYVQELEDMPPNAPDLEERIRLHGLMQNELQAQQDDLARISGMFDKQLLRDEFRNKGKSNIAVG